MILAGLVAARFTHYLALSVLLGAAFFTVFASAEARGGAPLAGRLRRTLLWASLAAFATGAAVLAFTAANMAGALGGAVDPAILNPILTQTDFGRVWAVRLLLAAGLAALFAVARGGRLLGWTAVAGGAALLATIALTGHAQIETGVAGLAHRAADAAHLLAGAVWLGALPVFLFLLAGRSGAADPLAAGRLLQHFHLVGLIAVAVLAGSGLVNSWFLVGDVRNLLVTPYGRLLLLKLGLFAVMLAFAADNRLRLVPALNRGLAEGLPPTDWLRSLQRNVRAEFLLGLGVLLAVALLGVMAPARG